MTYTRNQHVLSQWVLRNFRSDDSVGKSSDKQRVWCHTVYPDEEKNEIRVIPLPISSVAIAKNCFMLIDQETDEKFDIENELSEYEMKTSISFNELIQKHKFQKLLDVTSRGNTLEIMLNFMVIQMVLGFYNPQNKMEGKDEVLSPFLDEMVESFDSIKEQIINPSKDVKVYCNQHLFKKMIKVVNSKSEIIEKCKSLFVLSMLAEAALMPTSFCYLSSVRNQIFKNIYISGIYHTGYDFNSTDVRPVFTISPNAFVVNPNNDLNFLPLAHNLCVSFSLKGVNGYNSHLKIYSANPEKLRCRTSKRLHTYKVSHDAIDNMIGWVAMGNVGHTNTIYSPHELKDVEAYLQLQEDNEEFYYTPRHPQPIKV
ncbi:DUF4238 domain-containing protein [Shewanella scandinavica]|uniref:DUF4238 domain-containing protein n=1 Tax=Shewanella scandinavica TaxID=3063538 RepID=A0ABU3G2T6_9GAMM|nr:DUF4238 domain-containing protein [Shewanella sp. SP2S1-2]MDT3281642.1 DUF4238 domain-containing protein [Shewanella sp. SP2S1-2]